MADDECDDATDAADDEPIEDQHVEGPSFWRTIQNGKSIELNTRDDIRLENGELVWQIIPMIGKPGLGPIIARSRVVLLLMRQAIDRKIYYANRGAKPRAVPKHKSMSTKALPVRGEVPCPHCRPFAARGNPGEAWPDCECCGGDGVVSTREAREWLDAGDELGGGDE